MDKYEERVSKILEKKKHYDSEKNRKRKTLIQCISIALVCAISVATFVVIPKRANIINKPETTTSALSEVETSERLSDTSSSALSTVIHSGTTNKQETDESTTKEFVPLPNDAGGDIDNYIDPYKTKYRRIYYSGGSSGLNTFFGNLVSNEEYDEWMNQYYAKHPTGDGMFREGEKIVEPTRMKIVDFVMYFDIPRDVFEEANNTWCHSRMIKWGDVPVMNPKDYKEQEDFEVYNVDIIYTFDDEIINAYYERGEYPFDTEEEYLEAIENDGYITQTEEFIMLEGFEKVTLPALPPDAEPVYIDFDWRSKRCK